jgi:CO/xanthine dehydrogenase Mo-binding subunit
VKRSRKGKLRRRYGRQAVGQLGALFHMEAARKAYRAARERGARAAHNAALSANKYTLGAGAWDVANRVKKEMGD